MELYKLFAIEQVYDTKVLIEQEYKEHVRHIRQTGGDHVVIYDLTLLPNYSNAITIYFEDDEYPDAFCTRPTMECIPSITEGVKAFIDRLNEQKVTCSGFDIRISKAIVHPVDFRPTYYRKFTTQRLVDIINHIAERELL